MAASPDARRVALLTGRHDGDRRYGLSTFDLEEEELVEIASGGVSSEKMLAWSPDGQKLAFLKEDRLAVFDVAEAPWPHLVLVRDYDGHDLLGWIDDARVVLLRRDRIDYPVAHLGHSGTNVYCDLVVVDVSPEAPRDPPLFLTRGGPFVNRATLVTLPTRSR